MTEPAEARGIAVQVPVDLVEFEARLVAAERRLREQEARDQLLLGVAEAVRRLTDALGPMLEAVKPLVERGAAPSTAPSPTPSPAGRAPPTASAPGGSVPAVEPERLARAQARLREATPLAPVALAPELALDALSSPPPPGRRSWLLRALKRMVSQDPEAAGQLLVALLPGHRLAQIAPVPQLPGPSATVARVVVKGRVRRRLGWEMARLACDLETVSELAKLVRMRASPAQLRAAGVRLDAPLALALVALTIDPHWTVGHRFTLAHLDAGTAYLEVRNGARPTVSTERLPGAVDTIVRCSADALLPLLAGEPGVFATVEGAHQPLELVQGWFADATTA